MADNKMEAIIEYLSNRTEQYAPTVREIASAIRMTEEAEKHKHEFLVATLIQDPIGD
jgi:hypothetical protein